MMTDDEISRIKHDYDRDGFVILRGYLQGAALEELRERATRLSSELMQRMKNGEDISGRSHEEYERFRTDPQWQAKLKSSRGRRGKGFRNIFKNLNAHDPWFDNELNAGRHVPLIKALVGDDLKPASAAWFTKATGSREVIGPHRDAIGRPEGPKAGATIWIALDRADPENGCLHYGRGSHRMDYETGIPIPGFDTNGDTAVAVEVDPGDAVIHNALTVHWSGENHSDRSRRAVSYFYWGASNQRSFDNKLDVTRKGVDKSTIEKEWKAA